MKKYFFILFGVLMLGAVQAQIGKRFPSERKEITDPVTGQRLVFLTSTPTGDAKIYQTHNQWTADGQWLIFRSGRTKGEAFAVNEKTGDIVQVTEGGYNGMLNVARLSMKLYFLRVKSDDLRDTSRLARNQGPLQIIEVNLAEVFADSEAGKMKAALTISGYVERYLGNWKAEEIWLLMELNNGCTSESEKKQQQLIYRIAFNRKKILAPVIWAQAPPELQP